MVRYSSKAAKAIAFLKRPYNDIDIYVEDTANPNMWLEVLRTVLDDKVRLTSVTMLGGREKVISACKLDQSKGGRPRLYIIDGDLDFLLGVSKARLLHLYRLPCYCIENLLVREDAVIGVASASDIKASKNDIVTRLGFADWLEHIRRALLPVFVTYAAARALLPSEKTIKLGVEGLFKDTGSGIYLCEKKGWKRALSMSRKIVKKVGFAEWWRIVTAIKGRARKLTTEKIVSGKDYILPPLHVNMRKKFSFKGTIEQLKVMLAQAVKDTLDPLLRKRLRGICQQHGLLSA